MNSKANGLFEDYIATLFILISVILYTPIMTLLFLRKRTQPIRHRSPYLLMISLISSFILVINLCMILYLNQNENNTKSITCILFSYNSNVLHFMLILPYIFRAFRLLNVFNFRYFNTNLHKSKLREVYYLKLSLLFLTLMTSFFIFILSTKNLENIFPVEVDACSDKTITTSSFFQVFWISLHFLEILMLMLIVLKLRNVRDEFSISDELSAIGFVWLFFELFFILNICFSRFVDQNVIIVLDIIRNYFTVIISGLLPVIKSFKSLNLPICTTKECAANFNLLLITEKTFDAFYDYLKCYMSEGAKFLSFWTELNVFKHSNKYNERKSSSTNLLSTDIYHKYLVESSPMYIDFPPQLVENIHVSYKSASKDKYSEVFDALGEYVYNTLRDYYYPNFRMSDEYKKLETELEKDEIIYSRLVASSMISSIEIE